MDMITTNGYVYHDGYMYHGLWSAKSYLWPASNGNRIASQHARQRMASNIYARNMENVLKVTRLTISIASKAFTQVKPDLDIWVHRYC